MCRSKGLSSRNMGKAVRWEMSPVCMQNIKGAIFCSGAGRAKVIKMETETCLGLVGYSKDISVYPA